MKNTIQMELVELALHICMQMGIDVLTGERGGNVPTIGRR